MKNLYEALQIISKFRPDIVEALRAVDEIVLIPECVDKITLLCSDNKFYSVSTDDIDGLYDPLRRWVYVHERTTVTPYALAWTMVHEGQHVLDDVHGKLLHYPVTLNSEVRAVLAQVRLWENLDNLHVLPITTTEEIIALHSLLDYQHGRLTNLIERLYPDLYHKSDLRTVDEVQELEYDKEY